MKRITAGAAAMALAAGGAALRRVLDARGNRWPTIPSRNGTELRWHVVTVYLPPDKVMPEGRPPEPLAELGDAVEVEVRPAPGDKGTELAARLLAGEPSGASGSAARLAGDDPRQAVRSALRQAKQLLETGEVLQADAPPTTKSRPTNRPIELLARRAGGEGRL